MTIYSQDFNEQIADILINGGVGVLRTDTLYGLVARANDPAAVERIYTIKQRTPSKPPISLISSLDDLFDECDESTAALLNQLWPGKITVIFPSNRGPEWLTRGTLSVSYRLPDHKALVKLIQKTGPLIAPSANPEDQPPAMTIAEAEVYFGDMVDFYVDGGMVSDDTPSKIFRMENGELERLR